MNKLLTCVLLTGLLTCAGCFTTAPPDVAPKTATTAPVAKALPPVTPDQITDKNGHQVAQALEDEMNREQQQNMLNAESR
jgi:hypothetical protein